MGIFDRKKPCSNCGSTKLHRTCFSGGGKNHLDLDAKTIENIHKTVELNTARGHDPYKGLSSSQKQIYLSQRRG